MSEVADLLPELRDWNEGRGVSADEWILAVGRADQAIAFAALFWPDLTDCDGFVLREPVDPERLRLWISSGADRRSTEAALNLVLLENVLPTPEGSVALQEPRLARLASFMVDMLDAKLRRAFPTNRFVVETIDDDEDFGVTFYQA